MTKRSEVQQKIAKLITDYFLTRSEVRREVCNQCANDVLDLIEEIGMLPPERSYQKEIDECFDSLHYKVVRDVTDNSWEPERKDIDILISPISPKVQEAYDRYNQGLVNADIQKQITRLKELSNDLDSLPIEAIKEENTLLDNEKNIFISIMGEDEYKSLRRLFRAKHIELENQMIKDMNDIQKRGW